MNNWVLQMNDGEEIIMQAKLLDLSSTPTPHH
jgi:hypothetical protein